MVSNAIEHGSRLDAARTVAVLAEHDSARVRVAVIDSGQWVEPVSDSGRGRGLMLARALVDDLEISASDTGTTVHLIKKTTTS